MSETDAMKDNRLISRTRLANLPAFKVYEELQAISKQGVYSVGFADNFDEEREQLLLRRDDPLINLALAQFGASPKVGRQLYSWSNSEKNNQEYWRAIRQALLANQNFPPISRQWVFFPEPEPILTTDDLVSLFHFGDPEDVGAVLSNPAAKRLLALLYNREKPFQDVLDEQMGHYIYKSYQNPCLVIDDKNYWFLSDSDDRKIQEGIWHLLKTLPATEDFMRVLFYLILQVDPNYAHCPEEDPLPVLQRWQSVASKEKPDRDSGHFVGSYTGSGAKADFCALAAALYGRYREKVGSDGYEVRSIGCADSPDILRRCAFYGRSLHESIHTRVKRGTAKALKEHQRLLVNAMRAARQRDQDTFVFAAMCNDLLFQNGNARALLEEYMLGISSFRRYWARCGQIQRRTPHFDSYPVTEGGRQHLESLGVISVPTDDQKRLKELEASVSEALRGVALLWRRSYWILLLLIANVVMVWWRT